MKKLKIQRNLREELKRKNFQERMEIQGIQEIM